MIVDGFEVTATSRVSADDSERLDFRTDVATDQLQNADHFGGQPQAQQAAVNDWPSYFPSDWRAEGFNINRCTNYSNGTCHSTMPVAVLSQQISWMGDHTPSAWPSSDWGLEFGVALYNFNRCPNENTVNYGEQWWLNYTPIDGYINWTSGFPSFDDAYLDDNRLFDACGLLSHELGVRYPSNLVAGASYGFTLSAPRNTARPSSTFSAAFQAVHDDCIGDWAHRTDCMGLWNVAWPYSGAQSATVVNVSRYLSLPGCARMHDKWTDPITFGNGTSRLLPAPLNYYDTCFSNDWY